MKTIGLYLHVPFCASKCPYCDFYSLKADETQMNRYTEALISALEEPFLDEAATVDTIYFGGGTPILLGPERLQRILDKADSRFSIAAEAEITLEANPKATLLPTLRDLHRAGFNRLSMGLQSADEQELKILGRAHSVDAAARAVGDAREAGFDNISLDLMLGTPGQTVESVRRSADFCAGLGVEHISGYLLKIEPGTPFDSRGLAANCPDEDTQADIYLAAVEQLAGAGYRQYEISNFSHPGRESRHNLKYWNCDEYLGLGPSAHSFLSGRRSYFPRDLEGFLEAPKKRTLLFDDGPGGDFEEYAMLRLRLSDGLDLAHCTLKYGTDAQTYRKRARFLEEKGLVQCFGDTVRLTQNGFLLSNSVIGRILFG